MFSGSKLQAFISYMYEIFRKITQQFTLTFIPPTKRFDNHKIESFFTFLFLLIA